MMSSILAVSKGKSSGIALNFLSWQGLGAALLGVMLAKWTWVLFAPGSPAMPVAAWEASDDAGRLFGTARVQEAPSAPMGNIRLIGVFAHRTKGFAVMQIDEKQIGVALGEEVKPGIRLMETYSDHVMLEQAGMRQRVNLAGASAPAGVSVAPPSGMPAGVTAPDNSAILSASSQGAAAIPTTAAPTPEQLNVLQRQLDAADNLPPEQREMLKRQLENLRGQH